MINEISRPHFLQSISAAERVPFTKEDVYLVIKTHPGISTREILGQLGYAVSLGVDRQRLSTFLILIFNLVKKLENEGRIRIIEHDDRREYKAITGGI